MWQHNPEKVSQESDHPFGWCLFVCFFKRMAEVVNIILHPPKMSNPPIWAQVNAIDFLFWCCTLMNSRVEVLLSSLEFILLEMTISRCFMIFSRYLSIEAWFWQFWHCGNNYWVRYIYTFSLSFSSYWLLRLQSHDFSWAEKERTPSAIDSESIEPLSVLHSKLKFEW